jgi:hypothetical protein
MGDTEHMALSPPRLRLTRKDWIGDAVFTVVGGGVCLVAVFLPWANTEGAGLMNYSLTHPDTVRGLLETQWGLPALGLAVAVSVVGVLMLAIGPGRLGVVLGLLTMAAGVGIVLVARDATGAAYGLGTQAGLGAVITLFTGVLLVPIGLASAAVAGVLLYFERAATTDPPAPGNAPPS